MQPGLFDITPRYTVSEITKRLRQVLESTPDLQEVWVQGEMSNLGRPSSGHLYFTLKDANAQLRCVMWRNDAARLKFPLTDGLAVEAHGSISLYEAGGQYQLYVDLLHPIGEGALYAEFIRLKSLLETEGLFDPARKRTICETPKRIGIVTSPSGAALRDILHTLQRRYPLAEVVIAPTPVQGSDAPPALVAAINDLNQLVAPDVILLARGGGSIEDLWAFNDENVVRAVFNSKAPVITGVGHETDFTLVDFAADLRAPTPTAAAELATPITMADLLVRLSEMQQYLTQGILALVETRQESFGWLKGRLIQTSPMRQIQSEQQHLDEISHRMLSAQANIFVLAATRLTGLESRLQALNPLAVLQRGYAIITRKKDGLMITEVSHVHPGDDVSVRVRDGEFGARVSGS